MGSSVSKPNRKPNKLQKKTLRSECTSVEDLMIVWLDSNKLESDKDMEEGLCQLREIINSVKFFRNPDECSNFFLDIADKIIFLVVSGSDGRTLIPTVAENPQLNSIYIFCINVSANMQWSKEYYKVKGVHTRMNYICNSLKRDVQAYRQNRLSFHVIQSTHSIAAVKLDRPFMTAELIKEIFLTMEYDDTSKSEFVELCRRQYKDAPSNQLIIENFNSTYDSSNAIHWYTKHYFIYAVLNKALRTQELALLIKMGFLVKDIHTQIENLDSQANKTEINVVYRGQGMASTDLDKIRLNADGYILFSSFLSTSKNLDISRSFASSAREDPNLVGILYEMNIGTSVSSAPFGPLGNLAYYPEEEEVLFSINTIFRINNIELLENRLWKIRLTLVGRNDDQLKPLMDKMKQEMQGKTGLLKLGHLMFKMDQFEKAKYVFEMFLNNSSPLSSLSRGNDVEELLYIYTNLGYIYNSQDELEKALNHYEKAVEIATNHQLNCSGELFKCFSNIGIIYKKMDKIEDALKYFHKAIAIEKDLANPNAERIAQRLHNIADTYKVEKKYKEAAAEYENIINIKLTHLSPRHQSLAQIYQEKASVDDLLNNHEDALRSYEKALEIYKKLPEIDRSSADIHYCMATIYEKQFKYEEAIKHLSNAISVLRKICDSRHRHIEIYEEYRRRLASTVAEMRTQ